MPAETTIQTQAEAEEKMVDLPSDGTAIDVELPKKSEKIINPDPEPEAKEEEVRVEETKETASEEEMEGYGKKVQSRIDKLTKKLRESERREQAAVQYAQGVQADQAKLHSKEGYVRNMQHYLKHGDWIDNFYGEYEEKKVQWVTIKPSGVM